MTAARHHTSKPDHWTMPRATRDPAQARAIYGALQPMQPMQPERRGWLAKLVGRQP